MKPVGFYTSYTPGDDGLLAEMQESWGAQFQELNNQQRLWMLMKLAEELCAEEGEPESDYDDEVENAVERFFEELSRADRVGLMETLISQVKHYGRF
jgi:hypothetical protein